jgi:hypothetical protein
LEGVTVTFPEVAIKSALTVILFVFAPVTIKTPLGNVQTYLVALATAGIL